MWGQFRLAVAPALAHPRDSVERLRTARCRNRARVRQERERTTQRIEVRAIAHSLPPVTVAGRRAQRTRNGRTPTARTRVLSIRVPEVRAPPATAEDSDHSRHLPAVRLRAADLTVETHRRHAAAAAVIGIVRRPVHPVRWVRAATVRTRARAAM